MTIEGTGAWIIIYLVMSVCFVCVFNVCSYMYTCDHQDMCMCMHAYVNRSVVPIFLDYSSHYVFETAFLTEGEVHHFD